MTTKCHFLRKQSRYAGYRTRIAWFRLGCTGTCATMTSWKSSKAMLILILRIRAKSISSCLFAGNSMSMTYPDSWQRYFPTKRKWMSFMFSPKVQRTRFSWWRNTAQTTLTSSKWEQLLGIVRQNSLPGSIWKMFSSKSQRVGSISWKTTSVSLYLRSFRCGGKLMDVLRSSRLTQTVT